MVRSCLKIIFHWKRLYQLWFFVLRFQCMTQRAMVTAPRALLSLSPATAHSTRFCHHFIFGIHFQTFCCALNKSSHPFLHPKFPRLRSFQSVNCVWEHKNLFHFLSNKNTILYMYTYIYRNTPTHAQTALWPLGRLFSMWCAEGFLQRIIIFGIQVWIKSSQIRKAWVGRDFKAHPVP